VADMRSHGLEPRAAHQLRYLDLCFRQHELDAAFTLLTSVGR